MSVDPCQRFLGVAGSADPYTLLGLAPDCDDTAVVEAALRERLAQVYQHAGGRSPEADHVRQRLRKAADRLLESITGSGAKGAVWAPVSARPPDRSSPPTVAKLTDFDRHVLAVLVGCGGWNAASRSKLVAVATAYGVSVQGLMRVVTGLSEYAKSGGPRLGVAEITSAATPPLPIPPASAGRRESESVWLTRLAPEFRDESAWSTVKLAVMFGLLTLLVGIVAARILLFPAQQTIPAPELADPAMPGPATSRLTAPGKPAQAQASAALAPRLEFPRPPTFRGQALSAEAARAADACPQLPAEIDALARRITVDEEPSVAVYRHWDTFVREAAAGWVLIDEDTRDAIERAIFGALYAASDAPSVADRLLAALTPPADHLAEPIDVWRGAWLAGMLGKISVGINLSPAVIERAANQLEIALGGPLERDTTGFVSAAGRWLDRVVASLVEGAEFNPRVYDFWECWIAAQRRLGRGERHEAALMNAIEAILATTTDLARPGPSVNVLGRLISMADFETSSIVKERLLALFADQEGVGGHDLWVMTGLLAQGEAAGWFSEDLVLPHDADWMFRRRLADRISRRWPEAAATKPEPPVDIRGVPVDPALGGRWLTMHRREAERPLARRVERLMSQLVTACRLNEAACRLAAGDARQTQDVLDRVDKADTGPPDDPANRGPAPGPGRPGVLLPHAVRPGQPIGRDGEWATSYGEAGRRGEEKLKRLEALRRGAGTDLGSIDAEVFVRVVYHGTSQEVRALAQTIVAEQFATGPNVALELLDQFSQTSGTEYLAETIRRLTGRVLPSPHSESWAIDARLALVEHALRLREAGGRDIDRQTADVTEAYVSRQSALRRSGLASAAAATPEAAASALLEAWRERAQSVIVTVPPPDDLADLQRRHATRLRLAEGPLQRFVATQIGILEAMAYVTIAGQPARGSAALTILAESAGRRPGMTHVLEQAVEAERAIGRLWSLRLALDDGEEQG
ncbi:MAG: hypothetical protein ACYS0G_04615 [Planctomycetota bacterium]|jgi:hypothetical protein